MNDAQIIGLLGACETQRGKRLSVRTGLLEYVCRRALTASALEKVAVGSAPPFNEGRVYGPGLISEEAP